MTWNGKDVDISAVCLYGIKIIVFPFGETGSYVDVKQGYLNKINGSLIFYGTMVRFTTIYITLRVDGIRGLSSGLSLRSKLS